MQYTHWIRSHNTARYQKIPNKERGPLINDLLEAHWAQEDGRVLTATSEDVEKAEKAGFARGYARGRFRQLDDMKILVAREMQQLREENLGVIGDERKPDEEFIERFDKPVEN